MTSALIGFTGFVGSSLVKSEDFDLLINRSNLESLRGAKVDRLVCAGLPAAKWIANQKPQEDAENVRRLEDTLHTVQAKVVILISTIDVYPRTDCADESFECSSIPNHAYGTNRLAFERFVRRRFSNSFVVRLPALFGTGLKKNVIHDLLHDHRLERINPASRFQWYPLSRLSNDLRIVEAHALRLVNLFTEPLETQFIVDRLFPGSQIGQLADPPAHYDLSTRHATLFGRNARYIMTCTAVMSALREFVVAEQVSKRIAVPNIDRP